MFFIPIAAVVLFVFLLVRIYMAFNEGKMNRELELSKSRTDKLRSIAEDPYLESQIRSQMTWTNADRIMHDYLPDTPDWNFYISNADRKNCAMLITMAKLGKVPQLFMWGLGDHLRVTCDLYSPDLPRSQKLNEQFLLKMESELQNRGVDAELLFQQQYPKTGPWTPMRSYYEKNGAGFTDGSVKYRFTSK